MNAPEPVYTSHADQWEEGATVRNRPRRALEDDELRYYPTVRQPLLLHPLIIESGTSTQVELQSLYKYLNDVIIFETEIVNKTGREIAKGAFPFKFPKEAMLDAMSVVVDEDYHAYVAVDYMNQVIDHSRTLPLPLPGEIELSRAIPEAMAGLPPELQAGMELLGVAIAENTITADVAAFARDATVKRSIKGLMADHLADEGRHSGFWTRLVAVYWHGIGESARVELGRQLPVFLNRYLVNDLQMQFDRQLVEHIGLPAQQAAQVCEDLVESYPITSSHPMIANIRGFFQRSGILGHEPTRQQLASYLPKA